MTSVFFLYFFYNFYTFIKVEYQQNSNIINDVLDYVLCTVLSNKLFIKLTLLFLWVRDHNMKTKCAFKRYVQ